MSETAILRDIRVAVNSEPGCRVFRNNVGFDKDKRVAYGLSIGSADLIGIAHRVALAIEVKSPRGRSSPEQVAWGAMWVRLGGMYIVARSVDEALDPLRRLVQSAQSGP